MSQKKHNKQLEYPNFMSINARAFLRWYLAQNEFIITKAEETVLKLTNSLRDEPSMTILSALLDKMISPLVYMYERWSTIPYEERKMYYSKDEKEDIQKLVQCVMEQIKGG
jgi:hypothetical protein